ncbi:unnamed protein product [Trichogramma brassicae]|uniref:ER membrane protein complex subunit 10 n=1 Tax=Trichogramma brassicae TaxID=86971 RepID=A0A6H5IT44_9HYME|nr:unnamed protein product [Trichogramma brassicae]
MLHKCYTQSIFSELDFDGWLHVRLFHSLDDTPEPNFIERGNITISSIRSGAAITAQSAISESQLQKLMSLAKNNGLYRLKATVTTSSNSETNFLTSVLACNLLGSGLEDYVHIWLDSSAEPIAVNLIATGPCTLDEPMTKQWSTDVQVKYPDGGPVPDTATYIQKLEKEKLARESGEVKDNRSFFAKYWMYIVPALIFFVLSSATNPEAAAAGGGGGGGQRQ